MNCTSLTNLQATADRVSRKVLTTVRAQIEANDIATGAILGDSLAFVFRTASPVVRDQWYSSWLWRVEKYLKEYRVFFAHAPYIASSRRIVIDPSPFSADS